MRKNVSFQEKFQITLILLFDLKTTLAYWACENQEFEALTKSRKIWATLMDKADRGSKVNTLEEIGFSPLSYTS